MKLYLVVEQQKCGAIPLFASNDLDKAMAFWNSSEAGTASDAAGRLGEVTSRPVSMTLIEFGVNGRPMKTIYRRAVEYRRRKSAPHAE